MTSSSASDHGNPAGIAALMQKGTTSKGMEANKNFAKWLSCGIQISGTFGLHHVQRNNNGNILSTPILKNVLGFLVEISENVMGFLKSIMGPLLPGPFCPSQIPHRLA
jgi:hypothetical protein